MGPEVPSKSFGIQVGPNEVAGSLLGHFGVNLKPKGPGPSTNKMEVVFVGTFCVAHHITKVSECCLGQAAGGEPNPVPTLRLGGGLWSVFLKLFGVIDS